MSQSSHDRNTTPVPALADAEVLPALHELLVLAQRVSAGQRSQAGFSAHEYTALQELAFHRAGLTPRKLRASLGITNSSVTKLVDRLETQGLIRRSPSPNDRRSIILTATPKATRLVNRGLSDALKALAKPGQLSERRIAAAASIYADCPDA